MKNYGFLNAAKVIFKVLAWLILVIFIVLGIVVLITGGGAPVIGPNGITTPPTPKPFGIVFFIMGAFYFVVLYTISEIIAILLDLKGCCKPTV